MKHVEHDILFLTEGIPQLQEYLLSGELYWPLAGSLPRLTPGAVLLALKQVAVYAPNRAGSLQAGFDSVREQWRTAWEKKVAREVSSRLRLWSQYLAESLHPADGGLELYRSEVRGRVILQLLLQEQPNLPETRALAELDLALMHYMKPGGFLWDEALQVVFNKKEFWFLYGSL